ncbi:hypothetical protein [Streptomyces sp. NPDC088726]|uniref:hypothetical protein n=1 Tax=Streptomyces sp. NPDC088726 TaxID=3365874 RepID=UPI003820EA63
MNPAEPLIIPVLVSSASTEVSTARAIPKSMTLVPSTVSMTFEGFRSRSPFAPLILASPRTHLVGAPVGGRFNAVENRGIGAQA